MWWKSFCEVSCEISMGVAWGAIAIAGTAAVVAFNVPALITTTTMVGLVSSEGILATIAVGSGITYLCTRNNKKIEGTVGDVINDNSDIVNLKSGKKDLEEDNKGNDLAFSNKAIYEKLLGLENRVGELENSKNTQDVEMKKLKDEKNSSKVSMEQSFSKQTILNNSYEQRLSGLETKGSTNSFFKEASRLQSSNDGDLSSPSHSAGLRNRVSKSRNS